MSFQQATNVMEIASFLGSGMCEFSTSNKCYGDSLFFRIRKKGIKEKKKKGKTCLHKDHKAFILYF